MVEPLHYRSSRVSTPHTPTFFLSFLSIFSLFLLFPILYLPLLTPPSMYPIARSVLHRQQFNSPIFLLVGTCLIRCQVAFLTKQNDCGDNTLYDHSYSLERSITHGTPSRRGHASNRRIDCAEYGMRGCRVLSVPGKERGNKECPAKPLEELECRNMRRSAIKLGFSVKV